MKNYSTIHSKVAENFRLPEKMLEAIRTYRPAVVLLDIGIPGMDGYEVARRGRQQPELEHVTLMRSRLS